MKLVMPFLDESANFAHGFECGQVWWAMERGEFEIDGMFHALNYQQFVLMSKIHCYKITDAHFQPDGVWIAMKFRLSLMDKIKRLVFPGR